MKKQLISSKPGNSHADFQNWRGSGSGGEGKIYLIFFIWEDATNVDMHFYVANLKVLCNSCSK